ncbi:hypothetical protein H4N54_25705 [Limnospira fusiformis KN01]|uniref:Uncharacterized protein n=2 Tax=Limnospira TaxID=2596745 RepID=A0A9P1P2W1_9CYAN|nr:MULTISPECIES: hypothetical protein [Limnospira]MDY7051891.1 hypothetical protein [Limnospira fusiformis LS22]MDT9186778.1 hypothetical protein [Limnospira sp. PMC 894.15]MDT9232821.1 hypothetical protein [Limnospira sp. PMC 917.15]QNH57430.1 MAG: hypothetical protein H2674_25660 [Limnospira indica BM01]ULB45736.1 hypothetical protein H4N54_25705 [Limnospira fusiformis KN01]
MTSKQELIEKVAQRISWSQADVKRAVDDYGNVETEEDVIACCLHYAGPELKKRNYQIGSMKRVDKQQKSTIESLVNQLEEEKNFYQNELIPNLRQTINEQAKRIADLLKDVGKIINIK